MSAAIQTESIGKTRRELKEEVQALRRLVHRELLDLHKHPLRQPGAPLSLSQLLRTIFARGYREGARK